MTITPVASHPSEAQVDLLAIAVDEEATAPDGDPLLEGLDRALAGALRRAMTEERFRGNSGQTLMLHTSGRIAAGRVALVGVGARARLVPPALRLFAGRASRLANAAGTARLGLAISPTVSPEPAAGGPPLAQFLAEGATLGAYRFEKYLSEDKRTPRSLAQVELLLGPSAAETAPAITRGQRLAAAIARARDLVNEPAGALTPTALADIAGEIAVQHELELTVLDSHGCRAQKMGLFLAVSQGSPEEPRFIHMAWKPAGAKRRVVLVGKGVTFDSGGLSLKTNDAMLDMKTDMAGAASVISVMAPIAEERLPIEVHALAACCENMPSGRAYKLGDVLRSRNGKTVEINNTDAEGRLTLADAISYGLDLRPSVVLDFATLTGACMVALGPHTAGVMSNDEGLRDEWLAAAGTAGEDMWPLPLPERLAEQLKSDVADMKNTGERWGGALTAGLFLKEFVGDRPWLHVDLAGPSTSDKDIGPVAKGGTGFGVSTIFEYLRRVSLK